MGADASGRTPDAARFLPFTPRAFYDLAADCRTYASELARHDPHRVVLPQCHAWNDWLRSLRRYDRLEPRLRGIGRARPVARWQVATLTLLLWLILSLVLAGRGRTLGSALLLNSMVLLFITYYMVPERLYGTTIEEIEGKLLRVVQTLEEMLLRGEIALTEAAYFKAREHLEHARRELREQIDLAHRNQRP